MFDNNKILIISDIEPFIFNTLPEVIFVGKKYNLTDDELDYFFDWAINQILTDKFNMSVVHHYRHDIYLCVYSEISETLKDAFLRSVNLIDLNILKGRIVKTLVNGRDLFITQRTPIKNKT